jgi:integrase
MLTPLKISKAKPQAERYELAEPGGLRCIIHPGGGKAFAFRFRVPGSRKATAKITMPAGTSLHDARIRISEYRKLLDQGIDPRKHKPAVHVPAIKTTAGSDTVGELWELYKSLPTGGKKLRALDTKQWYFDRCILPAFGERPIGSIKRSEITAWLDGLERDRGVRLGDLALTHLRSLMRWHQTRSDDYVCPVTPGMSRYKASEHERERILNDSELRALWAVCENDRPVGALAQFILATGARLREASEAPRKEIDDEGVWTVPAARAKGRNGTAKDIVRPLSTLALSILQELPEVEGGPFIFSQNGCGYLSNNYDRWRDGLAKRAGIWTDWTWHDLRRTHRSLASRAGVRPDVAELVLGHAIKGVRRTYDRYEFLPEKKQAAEAVAELLLSIVAPRPAGNVTQLRRKRNRAA